MKTSTVEIPFGNHDVDFPGSATSWACSVKDFRIRLRCITFLSALLCLLVSSPIGQAAQPIIPFTAKLTDTAGRVIDGAQNITFRLYTQAAGGTAIWTEAHPSTPVVRGIVSVNLGDTTDLGEVEGEEFWVSISIGNDPEMPPRLKLPGYAASAIGGGSVGGAPVGAVMAFAGSVAPKGWLLCDGASISKDIYRRLAEVLGDAFGPSDESTFKLPDLRGRFPVGAGQSNIKDESGRELTPRFVGKYGGEEKHTLTIAEMPSHTHRILGENDKINGGYPTLTGPGNSWAQATEPAGGDQPHNTMPPFLGLNYIIKAK